jgi:MFS family permease
MNQLGTDVPAKQDLRTIAFRFVLIIGIVNFFADMTYEGGRSITGPFLGSLGASAAIVGLVAGFGELLGYSLRSVSGYLADRTHEYWLVIFCGYIINMMAVPALALAGNWPLAATLIVAERTGRAVRRPAVEAMISHAGKSIGQGWVFGFNEALDQTGATLGPLVTALILYLHGSYQYAFASLLIPAVACLAVLVVARVQYPSPQELEERSTELPRVGGFPRKYWLYLCGGVLIAAGFADFALIAFHFQKAGIVSQSMVPIYYSIAMATGAIGAFVFGRLLDRLGVSAILVALFVSVFSTPMVFLGGPALALVGMIVWGLGMGVQDSALKAILAAVVPASKRSTAFGVFDTGYGVAWFLGSAAMGLLYDSYLPALVVFSIVLQLGALPVLFYASQSKSA